MTPAIEITGLDVRFGATRAIDDVSLSLTGGTIVGLLGRNGAGKSTMLSVLAGFRRPTSGTVRVDRADPYEHRRLMSDTCLVRPDGDLEGSLTVDDALAIAAALRPRWDDEYAGHLVERLEIPKRTRVDALSRGQRSALAVTIGMASRAPLTMFDEPHLGMDAPSRYAFYDELLADYLAHPRTVIVSTHLIDEIAGVLEDVVILHHGRVLAHRAAADLQADGVELTGPASRVDALVGDLPVLSARSIGSTTSVVVDARLDDTLRDRAAAAGVDVGPIPLQDLFVSMTSTTGMPSKEHVA